MVAEWGVYDSSKKPNPTAKANVYNTVLKDLDSMPAIKGLMYFETAKDQSGHQILMNDTPQNAAAFQKIAADPRFTVTL